MTGFDRRETMLPTYWETEFTRICLGMKNGKETNFIAINITASSLFSLIADGKYHPTSLGRDKWKSLLRSNASLQSNCTREGFNAFCAGGAFKSRDLEWVSLLAKKIIVTAVIPASVLAQEVIVVTRTPVESWHWVNRQKMMGTKTSRPWDSFSFNNVVVIAPSWFFFKVNSRVFFLRQNVFLGTNSLWKARLNLRW